MNYGEASISFYFFYLLMEFINAVFIIFIVSIICDVVVCSIVYVSFLVKRCRVFSSWFS